MPELLLPRLKQEIEARLAELRPLIAEIEQLEAAKAALLARGELPAAPVAAAPARRRAARRAPRATEPALAPAAAKGEGERAPRGANRDAILALVEERPGVSVAEIASVTKIAKPTVATTVSKLKREGVLADEAGGVKLASRQAMTLSGAAPAAEDEPAAEAIAEAAEPAAEKPAAAKRKPRRRGGRKAPKRDDGASDAEWDAAAPASADGGE
ncbi:winged helix-turn-helix domain-containing protein [Conexibacter sp. JD483]|uniref:winged helix-turn-helix domain-containing protein n=1 Tax=unclassified Conexibacter TaxID=2627773 RepID=UPI0027161A22|nr:MULTISPECIES: winged helix-turn-helix domain-containing protein [unclassified Conexibacter]MDO8189186.1 winged helix-turn-helix domain-containing protein [Conexibacter sp. CPCC 205706]MDO8201919.1 winged helix-turn-helix domain-containing protein [Conexibacter sp. CPCC 205762]MDR9371950.1 winged helix-turn-helix domain-containing protein [Conexibacter sp. JD483]